MDMHTLLGQPHLSVITRRADGELALIQNLLAHKVMVDGRSDLEVLLGELLALKAPASPKTLDLIGHSTPGKSLLELGDWVIDGTSATVTAFFRELADQDVLRRLGITAVRLLGCCTAETAAGRATIQKLAQLLEVDVYGTRKLIYSAHYDAHGFAAARSYALVASSELENLRESVGVPVLEGEPWPQALDIDSLPTTTSTAASGAWPHRRATELQMGEVLRLVRRQHGAQMPGLLAAPLCEIVFPGESPSAWRRMQVIVNGEFVRFYPRGDQQPGVVYAVEDPQVLVAIVESLPGLFS